jgi:hypothetical protein
VFTYNSTSACCYLAAASMMHCLHTHFHPQTSPLHATLSPSAKHIKPFHGTLSVAGFTKHDLVCQQKLLEHFHSGTICLFIGLFTNVLSTACILQNKITVLLRMVNLNWDRSIICSFQDENSTLPHDSAESSNSLIL